MPLILLILFPFLGSLLGRDPMAPEALEARLDHIIDLFRVALLPDASDRA